MSFAAPLDVSAYFPATPAFTATTKPSLTEVTDWLAQDQSIISSKLSSIVDFTNVSVDGANILKQLNAKMTACKVDGALPHVQNVSQSEEKAKRNLCKQAKMIMDEILSGKLAISLPCVDPFAAIIGAGEPYLPNKYDKEFRY